MPWVCKYCGRTNSDKLRTCWDGVNGCGAKRGHHCLAGFGFGVTAAEAAKSLRTLFGVVSCNTSAQAAMQRSGITPIMSCDGFTSLVDGTAI